MFSQLVQVSEAMRASAGAPTMSLEPALCGCVQCGTRRMIAAPALGPCEICGADLQALVRCETSAPTVAAETPVRHAA